MRGKLRGFTLIEVMMGLALLGFALTVLIKDAGGSMAGARDAHMNGVVTDLARGKMYDIEEKLLKEGFSDTEQGEEDQDFKEEGYPRIRYTYKVEEVELPSYEQLMAMTQAAGSAAMAGSGSGSDGSGGFSSSFQDSALGGMLMGGMLGGGGGMDMDAAAGAGLIQGQYKMFQDILKVSIRKVTLVVSYDVMGRNKELKVVQYLTDASAMDKVLSGLGSSDLDDAKAGSGAGGSGAGGTGSGGGSTRPPIGSPRPGGTGGRGGSN